MTCRDRGWQTGRTSAGQARPLHPVEGSEAAFRSSLVGIGESRSGRVRETVLGDPAHPFKSERVRRPRNEGSARLAGQSVFLAFRAAVHQTCLADLPKSWKDSPHAGGAEEEYRRSYGTNPSLEIFPAKPGGKTPAGPPRSSREFGRSAQNDGLARRIHLARWVWRFVPATSLLGGLSIRAGSLVDSHGEGRGQYITQGFVPEGLPLKG
jgi:hypothetical protein